MFDLIAFDSGFKTLIFSPHNNPTLIISTILPMRHSLEWNDETTCSDNFMHFTWVTPVGNYLSLAWKIPWMKEPGRLQSMGL